MDACPTSLSRHREPSRDLGVMFNLLSRRSVSRVLGSPVCTALSAEDGPEQSMAAESCCDTDPEELLRSILRSLGRTINCLFAALTSLAAVGSFITARKRFLLAVKPAGANGRFLTSAISLRDSLPARHWRAITLRQPAVLLAG